MKKRIYIIAAVVAAFVGFLLYAFTSDPFVWEIDKANADGHQPYDMAVFDELMRRSLPNDYKVVEWGRDKEKSDSTDGDIVTNTQTALNLTERFDAKTQNLLIIQRFKFADANNHEISPLIAALNYANAGGDVLLVREQLEDEDHFVLQLTHSLGTPFHYGGYYSTHKYLPKYLREREDSIDTIVVKGDTLKIHKRYAPTYYQKYVDPNYEINEIPSISPNDPKVKEVRNALRRCSGTMKLSMDTYMMSENGTTCHGLRFHNTRTGGNVYVCTLGIYFSNIGVTIPDADKVIAYNMEKISQKPVVRMDYKHAVKYEYTNNEKASKENKLFAVLTKNEALSFAWILIVLLAVLALACGIYRKHPAKKDAHLIYVDETDPVAVREARFRESPLLHFIFQYSWLYKGQDNYTELFLINYRKLARYVNRKSGMELASAKEKDLDAGSKTLAQRTGLDAATVKQDLLWMHNTKLHADAGYTIAPKDYIKSQQIVEKYV